MAVWKILLIMIFGCLSLVLAFATLVIPLGMTDKEPRLQWLFGLGFATIVVGSLFTLFLRSADRALIRQGSRKRSL